MGLFLSCGLLAMTGCGKENNDEILDANSFYVEMAPMVDESGSKVTFSSDSYLNLLYDEGDKIYVNNEPFTLRKKTGGKWVAQGSSSSMTNATHDTLLGTGFSCIYTQSPASIKGYSSSSTGNYDVEFITQTERIGDFTYYNSGIVLAGRTSDSLVTMYPSFAVIRFYITRANINKLYVGFDNNVPVRRAVVSPQSGMPVLSNVRSNMRAPGSATDVYGPYAFGDLLYAVTNDVDAGGCYAYHVIVPLASDSVTTDLYIGWKLIGGQAGSKKTTSKVTLRRGVVYTVDLSF